MTHTVDLNSELVRFSNHRDLFDRRMVCYSIQITEIFLIGEWFAIKMPSTMVVWFSGHHLANRPEFRPPYEYRSAIQMPSTMVPGICIEKHLNNKQLKVHYIDVCFSDSHCIVQSLKSVYFDWWSE